MAIEFDQAKSTKNKQERGLPFEVARFFDWTTATVVRDDRKDYGEERFIAYGTINNRLHVMCIMPTENGYRVISLRKANDREIKRYGK